MLSVPPKANDAVTKMDANPPKPPTNGAAPIVQFFAPMYSCMLFPPALTAIPKKKKMTMVTTLRRESQYSSCKGRGVSGSVSHRTARKFGTHFSVGADRSHVDEEEEEQEEQRRQPGEPGIPVLEEDLGSGQISCDANRVVESVVPSNRLDQQNQSEEPLEEAPREEGADKSERVVHWTVGFIS